MKDLSGEITALLHAWKEGDKEAFARVVTLVYDGFWLGILGDSFSGGSPSGRRPTAPCGRNGLSECPPGGAAPATPSGRPRRVQRPNGLGRVFLRRCRSFAVTS